MSNVKFYLGEDIPLELHKVRMVQKLATGKSSGIPDIPRTVVPGNGAVT